MSLHFGETRFKRQLKFWCPSRNFTHQNKKCETWAVMTAQRVEEEDTYITVKKNILKLFPRSIDCSRKALRLLYYSTAHMYEYVPVCVCKLQPSLNHTMSSSLQASLLAPLCSLLNRLPLILQQLLALLCDHFSLDRQQLQVGESVSEWVSVRHCALVCTRVCVCVCVSEWVCLYLFSAFPALRQLRY